MGFPDAASDALQGHKEELRLKRLAVRVDEGVAAARDGAETPLASPTWTDRDDRSGRTETTSVASDDAREGGRLSDEDDGRESEGEAREASEAEGGVEAARGFRELLRSMQCQLAFLQTVTHKIEPRSGKSEGKSDAATSADCQPAERGLAPANDGPKTCRSEEERALLSLVPAPEPEAESAIDGHETRALQNEVRRLRAELDAARQENARLASVVQRLEAGADGSRDASSPVQAPCEEPVAIVDDAAVTIAGNVFLESESPRWLDGHEQCQRQTHELWATVRTLALYVQTYAVEKRTLREQRDEAEREAERAWEQNAALAGSRNPQQRIKYLQQLKADNNALRSRVRKLQAQLVAVSVSSLSPGSPSPAPPEAAASSSEEVAPLTGGEEGGPSPARRSSFSTADAPLLALADDRFERERNHVLQRMWRRQEELRAQLERLQLLAAADRAPDAETPRAVTSSGPARSSSGRSPDARAARSERKDARAFDAAQRPIAHPAC